MFIKEHYPLSKETGDNGLLGADPYLIAILEAVRRSDYIWPDSRDLWLLFGDMEGLAGLVFLHYHSRVPMMPYAWPLQFI
jgi:hypothetical protein